MSDENNSQENPKDETQEVADMHAMEIETSKNPLQDAIEKYYQPDDPNGVLNWNVFDEYMVVTGTTGSGKSRLVRDEIVTKLDGVPLWILDVKKRFSDCGVVTKNLDDLKKDFQYVFQPDDSGIGMFEKFCKKCQSQNDLVVIIDELHIWLSKQSLFRPHYDLVMTKRNDGVVTISISTDTKAIPNYVLRTITHVYSLRYHLRNDVDWLVDYIGEKAEFLLPPDKRKPIETGFNFQDGKPILFTDLPMLNDYAFVYRNLKNSDGAIIRGFKD